jgi:polysaccharide chain length determinant protein (PEP-CTERM system associated)
MQDLKALLITYAHLLWDRRKLALIGAWVACLLGWLGVAMLPDQYLTQARFYVDTSSLLNPLLKGISVNADDAGRDQEVLVMQRTLTSRPNLLKVAQMTDLDKSVSTEAGMQDLLDSLESRVTLKSQGTNLFQLDFSDNSPRMARDVVQALLTIFVESSAGNKREDIQSARSFIEEQIDDYEKQLSAAEQRLADFKVKNMEFFSSKSENFAGRLQLAREQIDDARRNHAEAIEIRDRLKSQLEETPEFLSFDSGPQIVVGDGGSPLQQRIRALQSKLDELRLSYTEKHPDVLRMQVQLDDLIKQEKASAESGVPEPGAVGRQKSQVPSQLYAQLGLKLAEAESVVASMKRKIADAEEQITELEGRAKRAPGVEAEFTSLNRDYEVMKGNYLSLLQRRESARIAQAADSSTEPVQFRIIAAPEIPAQPAGPNRPLFNAIVFVFGIVAGTGLVVLLSQLDDSVKSPQDLQSFSDYSFLGCVSPAATLATVRESFLKLHGKFIAGAASLAATFAIFFAVSPNLSSLAERIATRFL